MAIDEAGPRLLDRETSWLHFNGRVLQEAEDPSVPLLERLFFCGVFSSNLDEYYRVRVASLRSLLRLGRADTEKLGINPHRLLHDIHRIVQGQQERYGRVLVGIFEDLARNGIHVVDERTVDARHHPYLARHFDEHVRAHVAPAMLDGDQPPFLQNRAIYLVVELWQSDPEAIRSWVPDYALVEVPATVPRFVTLPDPANGQEVIHLDDVIRLQLPSLFPDREVGRSYAVKLTRDAELYLEEEFEGDLVSAIRRSLRKRDIGAPSRFLYDLRAPYVLVRRLQDRLGLSEEDLVLGGRYHNLHDYMAFPRFERADLSYPPWPPLPHPDLDAATSMLAAVAERDRILHLPYQSFDHVVRFLEEAADDPAVEELWLTVYRVARDSAVLRALTRAAERGKRVTVFMEVQARFDEESNLFWAERLEAAGVRTLYSRPGIKVHAKLALIVRGEGGVRRRYAYLATGNFNEKTARIYADHGLFTADERITRDVEQVFRFLAGEIEEPEVEHLLVAPFTMRSRFEALVAAEAERARAGEPSGITIKLNALEDRRMIERLHEAARAGVPIDAIVRGICRLVPGAPGPSGPIRVRSIVDRYLEHARVYVFNDGGREAMYLASADWMKRNLSSRVEVAVPIYDPEVRRQLRAMLDLQLADNQKARVVDASGDNPYVARDAEAACVRAQEAFREWVRALPASAAREP